jgi:hypothetical protein
MHMPATRPIDRPRRPKYRVWGTFALGMVVAVGGCARAQQPGDSPPVHDPDLPPAGYGTLRQEQVALSLQTDVVRIQIVPLDERVTRLLAQDTYASLHRLVESKAQEIADAAHRFGVSRPTPFLITFFGLQPDARFNPEDVTITSQNRLFRPFQILPLSPMWGGQQLNQRETATAVYLFEDGIRILDPLTVHYGAASSDRWEQALRELERERASVLARAAQGNP